jgi:hypothetical protein
MLVAPTQVSNLPQSGHLCRVVFDYLSKLYQLQEPGSAFSIVSSYGLDDRAIEVPPPAEAKDFSSSLRVKTGSGAHPTFCTMGTEGGVVSPG